MHHKAANATKSALSVTGKPVGRGNPPLRVKHPSHLTAEMLTRIGEDLYGRHWRAELARGLSCSKATITRMSNGERTITPVAARKLSALLANRISNLSKHLASMSDAHVDRRHLPSVRAHLAE